MSEFDIQMIERAGEFAAKQLWKEQCFAAAMLAAVERRTQRPPLVFCIDSPLYFVATHFYQLNDNVASFFIHSRASFRVSGKGYASILSCFHRLPWRHAWKNFRRESEQRHHSKVSSYKNEYISACPLNLLDAVPTQTNVREMALVWDLNTNSILLSLLLSWESAKGKDLRLTFCGSEPKRRKFCFLASWVELSKSASLTKRKTCKTRNFAHSFCSLGIF